MREKVDQESNEILKQAVRMADQLNIEPNIPRVSKKKIYRDKVPANSPEEYYKRALVIPIVDILISEMTHRFNKFICKAAKLFILHHQFYVPKSLKKMFKYSQFWKCMKKIL